MLDRYLSGDDFKQFFFNVMIFNINLTTIISEMKRNFFAIYLIL